MNYVLTYSVNGHEYTADSLTSFDEVNAEIRDIYDHNDEPVAILRIEQGHDGPRTWQIEYPPAPPAGTRVTNGANVPFMVGEGGRVECEGMSWTWHEALKKYGPLTEVVETEVQAAARRLRESDAWRGGPHAADVAALLAHVRDGGQLDG